MPVYALDETLAFPPAELAAPSGLLAIGGDLRPKRLLLAYASGIFPWYDEDTPILWYSPDPRFVLPSAELHVGRSLRKVCRRGTYEIRLDTAFAEVVARCASVARPQQDGTWITDDMVAAYQALHELGFAHSAEAWRGSELVGGLYGVCLGGVFCGESMFALAPDASKVAFVTLVRQLQAWDVSLVDCQIYTEHLARFGAREWPRARFLAALEEALRRPTRRGRWQLEIAATDPIPG